MNLSFLKQNIALICEEVSKKKFLPHRIMYEGVYTPKIYLETKDYQKTVNKLLENQELTKVLSKTMIIGTLNKMVKMHFENNISPTNESIKDFEVLTANIRSYKVYVPIMGLQMSSEIFDLSKKVRIIKVDINTIGNYIPNIENELDMYPALLEVNVSAAHSEKAMELAIEIGKYVISFLRLVDYYGWDDEDISVRLPGYGGLKEGLRVYAVDIEKKDGYISWQNKRDCTESLEIEPMTINDMHEIGLNSFGSIVDDYLEFNLTELQQSIIRSIIWFGESKVEVDDGARFIKLMLAIECLLNSNSSDPITATLRERMAFILGKTISERINIAEKMTELYAIRSRIVHHGNSKIKLIDLLNLENLVADVIVQFLTNKNLVSIDKKSDLQKYFEKLKYSINTSETNNSNENN